MRRGGWLYRALFVKAAIDLSLSIRVWLACVDSFIGYDMLVFWLHGSRGVLQVYPLGPCRRSRKVARFVSAAIKAASVKWPRRFRKRFSHRKYPPFFAPVKSR